MRWDRLRVELGRTVRHRFLGFLAVADAVHVAGVWLWPTTWLWLASKEGPFEHVGHAVLTAALAAWTAVLVRARRRAAPRVARWLVILFLAYLGFMLLEEIDWGELYGFDLGYSWIRGVTGGSPNWHNAQRWHGSIWAWALPWMTAPLVAFFTAGMGTLVERLRPVAKRFVPVLPTTAEGASFFVAALNAVVLDSVQLLERRLGYTPRAPEGDAVSGALGYFQITVYVLVLWVGVRAFRELGPRPTGRPEDGLDGASGK